MTGPIISAFLLLNRSHEIRKGGFPFLKAAIVSHKHYPKLLYSIILIVGVGSNCIQEIEVARRDEIYAAAWSANNPDYHRKRRRKASQVYEKDQTAFDYGKIAGNQEKHRHPAVVDIVLQDQEKLVQSRKENVSGFLQRMRQRNEETRQLLS